MTQVHSRIAFYLHQNVVHERYAIETQTGGSLTPRDTADERRRSPRAQRAAFVRVR